MSTSISPQELSKLLNFSDDGVSDTESPIEDHVNVFREDITRPAPIGSPVSLTLETKVCETNAMGNRCRAPSAPTV